MYATDSDGCPSRGCWNFLPIASKFVRKIWREGEAESYTWQRRGRDKRHKDKTNTLFMRRNNQRHRFAKRRRAALQPARQPGGYQIQTLLRYSPSLPIDSSFCRIHIVMLLQLPACLPERERKERERRERERERERVLRNLFILMSLIEICKTNAKFCNKVPNRNCKNVVRTSFDLQQNFLHREMHRERQRDRERERE